MSFEFDQADKATAAAQSATQHHTNHVNPNVNDVIKQTLGNNNLSGMAMLTSLLQTGNQRNTGNEIARRFHDVVAEVMKSQTMSLNDKDLALKVSFFNHAANGASLSSVLLLLESEKNNVRFGYQMIIEGSDNLKPIELQQQGRPNINLARPAGDVYDEATINIIKTLFNDKFSYVDAGAVVIPVELSGQEKDILVKSEDLRNVIFTSVNALLVRYNMAYAGSSKTVTAALLASLTGTKLVAEMDTNPFPKVNAVGLPVRTDVNVSVTVVSTAAAAANAKREDSIKLVSGSGYLDLSYYDEQAIKERRMQAMNGQGMGYQHLYQQMQVTQRYVAKFILTGLESGLPIETPETMLMTLASVTALSDNNSWMALFGARYGEHHKLQMGGRACDTRDLGAVGYECTHLPDCAGQPTYLDLRGDNIAGNSNNLSKLILDVMEPSLVYQIDVSETAPEGWLTSVLLAAAKGNPNANNAIIQACRRLTTSNDGVVHFDAFYKGNEFVVEDAGQLIPMGYFETDTGERKDLRTLDYLAMLNIAGSKGDLMSVEEFSRLQDDVQVNSYERLDRHIQTLTNIWGGSVKVKGHAHRITLKANWLMALRLALKACGFNVQSNNIGNFQTGSYRRGNLAQMQQTVNPQGQFFNQNQVVGTNYTTNTFTSW
jgi:hypothetical protein